MDLLALDPWFADNPWATPLVGVLAFTVCALAFRSLRGVLCVVLHCVA